MDHLLRAFDGHLVSGGRWAGSGKVQCNPSLEVLLMLRWSHKSWWKIRQCCHMQPLGYDHSIY